MYFHHVTVPHRFFAGYHIIQHSYYLLPGVGEEVLQGARGVGPAGPLLLCAGQPQGGAVHAAEGAAEPGDEAPRGHLVQVRPARVQDGRAGEGQGDLPKDPRQLPPQNGHLDGVCRPAR